MKKLIGYIIAIIGLVGIAMTQIPELKSQLPALPAQITDTMLLIISIVIVVLGILIVMKSSRGGLRGKHREVPIYEGKNVVGYRRN